MPILVSIALAAIVAFRAAPVAGQSADGFELESNPIGFVDTQGRGVIRYGPMS